MKYQFLRRLLHFLSVVLSVIIFLGLTAIPALLPGSPGGIYANATSEYSGAPEIYSLDEFHAFLESHDSVPDTFIKPETLEVIGPFSCYLGELRNYFSYYHYRFILGRGNFAQVSINHRPSNDKRYPNLTDSDIGSTMTKLPRSKSATDIYIKDDVVYCYHAGRLTYLEWISNGIGIRLWAPFDELSSYLPSDHILMKIVSKSPEVRQEAFDMLPDVLGDLDPLNYNPIEDFLYHAAAWALPVVVIVICFFAYKFIRKIWRKNHPIS